MRKGSGSLQVCPLSIESALKLPPASYDWLRLDPNYNCNLHCLYCHNDRSEKLIELEQLDRFLRNVTGLRNLQVGCSMEPTLDKRLAEFITLIGTSSSRPREVFQLQTNGTLLHRHDHQAMGEAGLNQLSVSIDTIDPETFRFLRGGASVEKIKSNLQAFKKALPHVDLQFMATVTKRNIGGLDELVRFGLDIGVKDFVFREMFHFWIPRTVDHRAVASISLSAGEFERMRRRLAQRYEGQATLHFFRKYSLMKFSGFEVKAFLTRALARLTA